MSILIALANEPQPILEHTSPIRWSGILVSFVMLTLAAVVFVALLRSRRARS